MLVDDGFADKVQLDPMKAIKSGPGQLNSFAPGRCRRRFPGRSFGSGSRARQSPFPNQRKIDVRLQVGSRSCHALLRNKRASRMRPRTGRLVHSVPRSCRGNGNPAMGSGRLTTQHRFADTPFGKASLYAPAFAEYQRNMGRGDADTIWRAKDPGEIRVVWPAGRGPRTSISRPVCRRRA